MLLQFSFGNFRSFKDVQTLNFKSSRLVSEDKQVDELNIAAIPSSEEKPLKIIGIYGANASGKSNVLKALSLLKNLITASLETEGLPQKLHDPFRLIASTEKLAGYFQAVLALDGKKYRYGFTINKDYNIESEWLFGNAHKNETYYFKRNGNDIQSNPEFFREGLNLPEDKLRKDTLFLTFCTAYDGPISREIKNYFSEYVIFDAYLNQKKVLSFLDEPYESTNTLVEKGQKDTVLGMLRDAGINYDDIEITSQQLAKDSVVKFVNLTKSIYNQEGKVEDKASFNLDFDESDGTKKLYSYIGKLSRLLSDGGLLVSDEIDSNFHPSLLKYLIQQFQDPKTNKGNAQLLLTTHDTNLLDHNFMRRDQFYFTEKSLYEDSILYSLSDLKGIRNNADFARQYLAGLYGALPILGGYLNEEK